MLVQKSRLTAYAVYLIFSGVTSLSRSLIFTVNMVYQVEVARLNPLQLVLVGTTLESVAFVCQIPTGVLADIYSRRLAVILGIFLFGLAFILEGSFPRFDVIVASQILFGVNPEFAMHHLRWYFGAVCWKRYASPLAFFINYILTYSKSSSCPVDIRDMLSLSIVRQCPPFRS